MIDERKQPQDPDVADEPGTQPKKYYKGLSKKDKDARAKHFARGSTKPAPGDKDAKTKPSKHTLKYRKMFLTDSAKALANKAKESGMPLGILKQVFKRGVKAWQTGHRPGTTAVQWGLARVNSFITKGKGTWGKADSDLAAKVRKSESYQMEQIKTDDALKRYKAGKAGFSDKAHLKAKGLIPRADGSKRKSESLWDNIRKKRARIAKGSGEKMNPKGTVSQKAFKSAEKFSDSPRADAARRRNNKLKGKKYKGESETIESLWDNIRKKRERIKRGSGERMRKKGEKGAPTAAQMKAAESILDKLNR